MNNVSTYDFPASNRINSVYLVHTRWSISWCRNPSSVNAGFAIASIIPQGRRVFRRKQNETFILVHLLGLKLGEIKKHYQLKSACKRACMKVDITNTPTGNHSRYSELQTRLNHHQCRKIWGSD